MEAEGIWLESPTDMAKAWPGVWKNAKAARDWISYKGGFFYTKSLSIENSARVNYQLVGARQHWRSARFDPAVVPDPRAWLEARLGPLAGFEVEAPGRGKRQAGRGGPRGASTDARGCGG
jgi:hypothetical protein